MIDLRMTDKVREVVRVELARRQLKQTELADKIGKSRQYVNAAIQGRAADMPEIWQQILDELGLELIAVPKGKEG